MQSKHISCIFLDSCTDYIKNKPGIREKALNEDTDYCIIKLEGEEILIY